MEKPSDGPTITKNNALDILRNIFGFSAFRGLQEEAVSAVIEGNDALILMPTGGGKSLCYQVPALCRDGMGVVISPLIALMDDQVAGLRQLGVRAAAIHSELTLEERRCLWGQLKSDQIDLLYLSPERLLTPDMLDFLNKRSLSLIAIDEAHCVSAWGHEFRPEYRELAKLKDCFPHVPRVALTATADPRTRADILSVLKMDMASVFVASFHRENLFIQAQPKHSETRQVLEALKNYMGEGAAIVYCGSRRKTERIAHFLREQNLTALAFHAGLSPIEKRALLLRFRSGEAIVVVATIAFGMGIDRPDVRAVIHLDMPASPEAYYQQIGRAGRDGEVSHTLLLYGGEAMARARYWLEQSQAPEREKRVMQGRLESMIALTETTGCRTHAILASFGETLLEPCGHCDTCRYPPVTFEGKEAVQKVLSAVYRTGERFGAVVLASVLRGRGTEMVKRHALHTLSVFGIGRRESEDWWRMVIRQLIARGAIRLSNDHGGLKLHRETARPLLRGELSIPLMEDTASHTLSRLKETAERQENLLSERGNERFLALKEWRIGEAREQEIPPYIIFHDAALREIAHYAPKDIDELGQIKGVGHRKLERYGAAVLTVLHAQNER